MLKNKIQSYLDTLSLIFFFPVNERETLLRPQDHGVWAGGHPTGKGEAGGGA